MKLKDKFYKIIPCDETDKYQQAVEDCVKISKEYADEFSIGFAVWCDNNYFRMGNTSFWAESMDWDNDNKFTTKELLEIYKKEQKL